MKSEEILKEALKSEDIQKLEEEIKKIKEKFKDEDIAKAKKRRDSYDKGKTFDEQIADEKYESYLNLINVFYKKISNIKRNKCCEAIRKILTDHPKDYETFTTEIHVIACSEQGLSVINQFAETFREDSFSKLFEHSYEKMPLETMQLFIHINYGID